MAAASPVRGATLILGTGSGRLLGTGTTVTSADYITTYLDSYTYNRFDVSFDPSSSPELSEQVQPPHNFGNIVGNSGPPKAQAGFSQSITAEIANFFLTATESGFSAYPGLGQSYASATASFTVPFTLSSAALLSLTTPPPSGDPSAPTGALFNSFNGRISLTLSEWENGQWNIIWDSDHPFLGWGGSLGSWNGSSSLFELPVGAGLYQLSEYTQDAAIYTQLSAVPIASVPEPAGAVLLLATGFALNRRRKARMQEIRS